jgi:hypothetical protein
VSRDASARISLLAAVVAAASLALSAILVPELPPLALLGGDAPHYAAMAAHPLEPVAPPPWVERIGVPLVVAALPLRDRDGFLLVAVISMIAASVLVAAIVRHLGVAAHAQLCAALLTTGSYVGVHAVYNPYYVDPTTLALTALAIWLALRRRVVALAATLAVGVLVKEVVATLIVLLYLFDRGRRGAVDLSAAARTAALSMPTLVVFVLVHALVPAADSTGSDQRLAFLDTPIFSRGLLETAVNPLVSLFGLMLVLWAAGVLVGSTDLRRLHVWALLALPILVYGHWERTLGVFVPLAVMASLVAMRNERPAVVVALTAGSYWITAVVGGLTIGEGRASVTEKVALAAPGALVGLVAIGLALSARRTRHDASPTLAG